ncbi:hypothetical protein B0H17DRAFT_1191685 [Mycena rosella]|uniref:Uncharacterized protein n=1 Tax=Mycena rosella TaxID=1033263 RepID=A0AAD7GZ06_MYCRO|nr:hypothetical protein B0H17DRAFT_1191685 [Mycena rosella]
MQLKSILLSAALAGLHLTAACPPSKVKRRSSRAGSRWGSSFTFTGVDGNSFVHAFQNCGGIANNWQSWAEGDHHVFDDSEVQGFAGARVISRGIYAVTGQNCQSISQIGY